MKLFFEGETTVKLRNIYRCELHQSHVICPPRPAHALVYYFKGRNVFHYGDLHLTCDKNTLIYLPHNVPYTIDRMDETEIIVIDFITSGQFLSDPFCKKVPASGPIPDRFLKMLALWRRQTPWEVPDMLSLFWQTVGAVQHLTVQHYLPESRTRRIAPAIEYMEEHFAEPDMRISDLAEMCGMSERYFLQIFRAYLSSSPKEFLIRLRLNQAKQLLVSENLSVSEIAALCGFSDLFYFSRSFRSKTGLTPSEYRKNYVLKVNTLEPDRLSVKNKALREDRY